MSRLLDRAARDVRVAFALALVDAIVALVAIRRDTFLNNEGIFGYLFAGMAGDDPLTTLFFLKSRPPLAALYAAPAALGFDAFAIVHALVAVLAVPLTAIVARAAGHRWPNLPAALVAASAMMVPCAASGVFNSDGMTLGILAAALLFAWDRPALAGVVCAILPLARAEMALLVVALAIHALFRADRRVRARFAIGLVAPAIVYALAGALYHRDAIWFLHFPPHVTHSVPYSEIMGRRMFGGQPHAVTLNYLLLTPAVGLLLFLKPSRLTSIERVWALFLIVFVSLLSILPGLHPLNFGDMPRYVVPALPFLALVVSRAIEPMVEEDDAESRARIAGVLGLAALLAVAHVQDAWHHAPALLFAVAGWSLVALVAATRWRRAVPILVVALSALVAPVLARESRLEVRAPVTALGRYLLAHEAERPRVLTNVSELPLWVARHGGEELEIHHMMAADQRYEADTLTNGANGQRRALHALLRAHWYGPIVFEEDVPRMLREGTWLALREDARTTHILDPESLRGRSETIDVGARARIVKVSAP